MTPARVGASLSAQKEKGRINSMISEQTVSFFIQLLFGRSREIESIAFYLQQSNQDHPDNNENQDLSPRIRRANCMSLGKIVTLLA